MKQRRPGLTGEFPRGKFDARDQGGLMMAISVRDRTVLIDFGAPVTSLGMSRDEAIAFAKALTAKAEAIT